jgi:signal peptidase II
MKRTFLMLGLIIWCIGCDQGTKRLAEHTLKDRGPVSYINGCVQFFYAENTGAFGSLGAHWPGPVKLVAFVILPILILGAVAVSAVRSRIIDWPRTIGSALIVGGGMGNIIDRLASGYVVDFMYLHLGRIGTNVFNVADLAVMAGVIILVLDRGPREQREAG